MVCVEGKEPLVQAPLPWKQSLLNLELARGYVRDIAAPYLLEEQTIGVSQSTSHSQRVVTVDVLLVWLFS